MRASDWALNGLFSLCSLVIAAPSHQIPILDGTQKTKQLHGRFLHISDLHPDPHYKYHSSVEEDEACHRGKGPSGYYGAETTSCDSPFSLINDTFVWIEENLKDKIDFVLWTGDSARHDNDERIPRDEKEIHELNEFCVSRFMDVFGEKGILQTPVVPTWGNNDVLPHNIFYPGPNKWTRAFLDIWRPFIPESQRHGFEYGGWFWSEVIPNKLAVLSVNSLFFADNNAAVDGCADRSQPGYAQFDWMRVQLQILRRRGMKAIIIGHQAPARTESKQSWDESCWQKYTLWLYQYRDVVVGTTWGHMNIDHFMLQDVKDVDIVSLEGNAVDIKTTMEDEISVQGITDYLAELRKLWHKLPTPPKKLEVEISKKNKKKKKKRDEFFKEIGGSFGQRYSLSLVSPSVVPNYFPTLRVMEYNISGLESATSWNAEEAEDIPSSLDLSILKKSKKKFKIPRSPSKSSPPGPAYSPQTFTWLKYTQYWSNLTVFNNDFKSAEEDSQSEDMTDQGWKSGKHHHENPASSPPKPKKLKFEIEYDTAKDDVYGMKDLTVLSYLKLAETIGKYKPIKTAAFTDDEQDEDFQEHHMEEGSATATEDTSDDEEDEVDPDIHDSKKDKKHKKKKKKHHRKKKLVNKVWHAFIRRAFVGAVDDKDLEDQFGRSVVNAVIDDEEELEGESNEL